MLQKTPEHIAIIMDGNGRWAQRRGRPRVYGHVRGSSRVKGVVREASRLGVKALTLYAFSTENWNRPEAERHVLWTLLKKYLKREADDLMKENVRLRVIGETDRLSSDVRSVLDPVQERLRGNTGLELTFALSYGGQREIVEAARAFAEDCVAGNTDPKKLSEAKFESYLWSSQTGPDRPVDLFIRTSGERRISNFLLWQSAYAELVFVEDCWPDFLPKHLTAAVEEYTTRERRFGGLCSQSPEVLSDSQSSVSLGASYGA